LATYPHFFSPHPNLSDEVNRNFVQSEIEGGVFLRDLTPQSALHIQTQHHGYTLVHCSESQGLISGHPQFCPQPVLVRIAGSTWGGSMLKVRFIGRGMHLEFKHPEYDAPIITSRILEIRECDRDLRNPAFVVQKSTRLRVSQQ
jgi:hypothetical protein